MVVVVAYCARWRLYPAPTPMPCPRPPPRRTRRRLAMTPRTVAAILLSLVRLGLRPNARFVHGLLLAVQPVLATGANEADLVQLALALPALGHGLPPGMTACFQGLAHTLLPRLRTPEAREAACAGLAQLGLDVGGPLAVVPAAVGADAAGGGQP